MKNRKWTSRKIILLKKWRKLSARLKQKMENGDFAQLSRQQKNKLLHKLRRCYQQLQRIGISARHIAIGGALSLLLATPMQAQFIQQTGANNPFDGLTAGQLAPHPFFVDIDNDGDFDAFVSSLSPNTIQYYENTGTNSSPIFSQQFGANNPFDGILVPSLKIDFVDIDNDGDFDTFIGDNSGNINYFENTGTGSNPVFTQQVGASNPFDGISSPAGSYVLPTSVDIDNDGDFDVFAGEFSPGIIRYYENTGTNSNPIFTEQIGANNPFDGVIPGYLPTSDFVDIDNDGDFDAFVGTYYQGVKYYENTGTNSNPIFTEQTGANNPLSGITGYINAAEFVDIDNDGDLDAFNGGYYGGGGTIQYFENVSPTIANNDADGDGTPDIADPCDCTDPQNPDPAVVMGPGGGEVFHELVTVNSGAGETWNMDATTAGALDATGTPLALPTTMTEISAGVYTLDFYHEINVGYTGDFSNATATLNIANTCTASCSTTTVPTLSQWGLIILTLLLLNLGILMIGRKERMQENYLSV